MISSRPFGRSSRASRDARSLSLEVAVHHRHVVVAPEWRQTREALVEHAAEGVDVGAAVGLVALDLLGRDVLQRAHELPGLGELLAGRRVLGQPEVGQVAVLHGFRPAARRHEDVGGLDVAMHQPALVRGVERAGHLADHRHGTERLEAAVLGDHRAQVGSLDVAHRDEQQAVDLARLVERDDVRVVDGGREARLAVETGAERLVLHELGSEHLQRDLAPEAQVLGPVHDTHAAAADDGLDAVARQLRADAQVSRHLVAVIPARGRQSRVLALRRHELRQRGRSRRGRPRTLRPSNPAPVTHAGANPGSLRGRSRIGVV